MRKIFVYGIFLNEGMRKEFGMRNPKYATVKDFSTVGLTISGQIVAAVKAEGHVLTGLIVDLDKWVKTGDGEMDCLERLDRLEGGYTRIKVTTTDGDTCWIYTKFGHRR